MNMFLRPVFVASAGSPGQFPPEGPPEVAFLGRSNVGKSSAINALTGRRRLAFASKAPGRTQTINFYDLGGTGRLVDLPGYGYARVSQAVRAGWDRLAGGYLAERRSLVGVVVLMDARRPVTPQDWRLVEWIRPLEVECLYLLAKSDKLSRPAGSAVLRGTCKALGVDPEAVLLFSCATGAGVEDAKVRLSQWLHAAHAPAGNKRPPVKGEDNRGRTP